MKTTIPLDNRACLYGEVRLSDPQVIALRAVRDGRLVRKGLCWFVTGGGLPVKAKPATLANLSRRLLIRAASAGYELTGAGKDLLAKIDAEAA